MKRILVIEDDDQIRQLLKQILEMAEYEVIDAPNGNEGIRHFKESQTDLIIIDMIMPEKDGMETIIELKHEFPDVKIIAISGGSRVMDPMDYLQHATQAGVLHTFTKPFDTKELLDVVEKLLLND